MRSVGAEMGSTGTHVSEHVEIDGGAGQHLDVGVLDDFVREILSKEYEVETGTHRDGASA